MWTRLKYRCSISNVYLQKIFPEKSNIYVSPNFYELFQGALQGHIHVDCSISYAHGFVVFSLWLFLSFLTNRLVIHIPMDDSLTSKRRQWNNPEM